MVKAKKRWRPKSGAPVVEATLQESLSCSPTVARLLVNRGFTDPESAYNFLNPSLSNLEDPFLLPDIQPAVERIARAREKGEKVYVHGDYDGDGVTSAALWSRLLTKVGVNVTTHVPHRHRDGYDMRSAFVQEAAAAGASLIVTTDCGIQRVDEVEEASRNGIDVIITDHHTPGEQLPRALAVINPHRKDSTYPYRDLAGVGVAFRTGEALVKYLGYSIESYRAAYLDLAAIGTVMDVVPLSGENRIIVKYGLEMLRNTRKAGLKALMDRCGLGTGPLSTMGIGFRLGPRLNAVGRLDDAALAYELLVTTCDARAQELAGILETANQDRRAEEQRILNEALEQVISLDLASTYCLVLSGAGWNGGVIGIVAGKLAERFHRPTILIALNPETGICRGSARSIPAFHMLDAITENGSFLMEFGGHSHAAGLSMYPNRTADFRDGMNRIAQSRLTVDDLVPEIDYDFETFGENISVDLVHDTEMLEPWGKGNDEPRMLVRAMEIRDVRRFGMDGRNLKLKVGAPGTVPVEALLWSRGDDFPQFCVGEQVDMIVRASFNTYGGDEKVQFTVDDIRHTERA